MGYDTKTRAVTGIRKGQKFDSWEVIRADTPLHSRSVSGSKGNRHTRWICRCKCGTEKPVDGQNLKRGLTKSCGDCLWNCEVAVGFIRCASCGHQFDASAYKLSNGKTSACLKCRQKNIKKSSKRRAMMRLNNPSKYRAYRFMFKGGRSLGNVDLRWLENKFNETTHCKCCGKVLTTGIKKSTVIDYSYPSVDRRDNSRGYSRDNIEIICWRCNNRKSDMTISEVATLLAYMTSN